MKTQHKSVKMALLLGIAAWTLTSCQDWLTLYPQTQVVEENFWEDKNDLEGVRYAAYTQMCGTVTQMALWGDLRSDSYDINSGDQNSGTKTLYQEIREGRIERDSSNTYFDWSPFYTTINYCNKVLYHGPEVLERDKQFTAAEWRQMKAEITALRALNYFYLIRAFKDIPYSTKVINKDVEVEYFPATNQLVVLDSLIADAENVMGQARNRFSSKADSKGLITNSAIYAMLSDMYLWRASLHQGRGIMTDDVVITNIPEKAGTTVSHSVVDDYKACMDYADKALESLAEQTQNSRVGQGVGIGNDETLDYGLTNCNLIKNNYENFSTGTTPRLTAFDAIFTEGNSDESIFELQFNTLDNRQNGVVTSNIWGGNTTTSHLTVSRTSINKATGSGFSNDSRMWFSAWDKTTTSGTSGLPGLFCFKWNGVDPVVSDTYKAQDLTIDVTTSNSGYSNWIIYRMSDVMLQKAEAEAALLAMGQTLPGSEHPMRYVNAIHRRWYCNDASGSTAQPSEDVMNDNGKAYYDTSKSATLGNAPKADSYEIAVMNERQLEFLGEGKRWFDLVRYAERYAGGQDGTKDPREWTEENPIGNGAKGVEKMADTFLANHFKTNPNYTTLKNRFKNRYGLYNLVYYMEIKASHGKIEQNPVWNKSQYEQ